MIIKSLVNVLEPSMEHEQTYNKEEDDSEEITVKQKEVYFIFHSCPALENEIE